MYAQRHLLFWGSVLLLLGLCFALKAAGILDNVWEYFWPFFLLLAGGWLVASAFLPRRVLADEAERVVLDLQGARRANLTFEHGAGQMHISGGAPAGALLTANQGAGLHISSRLEGDQLTAKVECAPTFVPFVGPESGVWRFRLSNEVPLHLTVESGASQLTLDLSEVQASYLKLEAGASSITLTAPARVANALLDIEAGAANLNVQIPEGVAARIRVDQGISSLTINQERFPRLNQDLYQSGDYDHAPCRVELNIEAGVSAVNIA